MRMMIMASVLALSACGPMGFGGDSNEDGGVTAPEPVGAGFEADLVFTPSEALVADMNVPKTISATYNDDGTLTVSGTVVTPQSAGLTNGASVEISGDDEARVGGNKVVVRVLAKGTEGASMRVAYSTNEVGNSGWKDFALTGEFAEYSFPYNVNQPQAGQGDYVGILPVDGDVIVARIGVDIEAPLRGAAPAPDAGTDAAPAEDGPVVEDEMAPVEE